MITSLLKLSFFFRVWYPHFRLFSTENLFVIKGCYNLKNSSIRVQPIILLKNYFGLSAWGVRLCFVCLIIVVYSAFKHYLFLNKMTVRTPSTPASKIDRTPLATPGGHRAREEKIVVTIRLRPLNKREKSSKDQIAWECTDNHTIVYRHNLHERTAQPTSFMFGN